MNNSPYLDLPTRTLARAIADRASRIPGAALTTAFDLCTQAAGSGNVNEKRRALFLEVTAILRSRI